MEKSEVCVKLTRKNCKKVLEILEMFGEAVYNTTRTNMANGRYENNGYPVIYCDGREWVGHGDSGAGLSLIKPRQLRNILAKEHLKAGDFFIGRNNESEFVGIHDKIEDDPESRPFAVSNWRQVLGTFELKNSTNDPGWFEDFLRYATDEEKALLEPKKEKPEFGVDEFEVGDWYISKNGTIFNYQEYHCYGWLRGEWNDCNWSWTDTYDVRKATEPEVIEALKKECVKRGLVSGVYITSPWMDGKSDDKLKGDYEYRPESNQLVIVNRVSDKHAIIYSLFKDGKWAEPVQSGKIQVTIEATISEESANALKGTRTAPVRTFRKIEIAEFIGIPVEQLEIID